MRARAVTFLGVAQPAPHSPAGRVTGRVLHADGSPAAGVNVTVLGMRIGDATDDEGRYELVGVPVGNHQVRAQMMGRIAVVKPVAVSSGATASLDFRLDPDATPVAELPEFEVHAGPRDLGNANTEHRIGGDAVRQIAGLDSYRDVAALVAGVVSDASGIHIRGGREDEVKTLVNHVDMTNLLTGQSVGCPLSRSRRSSSAPA